MNSFVLYKKCQDAIEADDLDTLKNILELKPTLIHHSQFGDFGYGETLLVFACKIGRAQACFFFGKKRRRFKFQVQGRLDAVTLCMQL